MEGRGSGEVAAPVILPSSEGDFVLEQHLMLECGRTLVRPNLHYAVYGALNAARDNAVLVCHALSGSALAGEWWPDLFTVSPEAEGIVDLDRDCVICVNLLGSCYGSTGPASVNPESFTESDPEFDFLAGPRAKGAGRVYGPDFPLISVRDNVRAQAKLMDFLNIRKLGMAIGGSIGGMQALEWAILFPDRVARAVVIAVAPLNAMGLALNHLQRKAIIDDPEWRTGLYPPHRQPKKGLALARQIATLSYKSATLFNERFGRNPNRNGEDPWALDERGSGLVGERFDIAGYLDSQGLRFVERFDANSYLAILRTMDLWDPVLGHRTAKGRLRPHPGAGDVCRHLLGRAVSGGGGAAPGRDGSGFPASMPSIGRWSPIMGMTLFWRNKPSWCECCISTHESRARGSDLTIDCLSVVGSVSIIPTRLQDVEGTGGGINSDSESGLSRSGGLDSSADFRAIAWFSTQIF